MGRSALCDTFIHVEELHKQRQKLLFRHTPKFGLSESCASKDTVLSASGSRLLDHYAHLSKRIAFGLARFLRVGKLGLANSVDHKCQRGQWGSLQFDLALLRTIWRARL